MTITSLNSITLQHYAAEVFDPLRCSKRSSVCRNVMGHSRFVGRRSHAAAALLFQEEVAEKREVDRQAVKAPGSRTGRHVSSLINAMSVQSYHVKPSYHKLKSDLIFMSHFIHSCYTSFIPVTLH